ncbi:hypothetical protein D3C78_1026650 [compost metagenome]
MPRAWRRAQVHVVLEAQQALLDERLQPLIDHRIQFVQRPANEQLRLQVRVQCAGVAQDLFAAHARGTLEEARQQCRQGEDVQYVVAVVGHQDGVLFVQIQNLAQGIALLGQQVHVLHVLDQRPAVTFRQGGVRRVRHLAQQRQIQVEHPCHGAVVQGQAAGGQQRQGDEVDRVDRCRFVQMPRDLLAEAVGGFVEPGRSELRAEFLLAPVRLFAVEELRQFDRLAEVHRDLAEALLECADDFEDVEDRFFLLGRTAQFAEVGPAFQYALVADVHRHEDNGHARRTQEAAQGDRQHPGFRLQHAPGARTATLDEILHREALGEQGVQVFVEHRGVQRVALERPAHEKRAATT